MPQIATSAELKTIPEGTSIVLQPNGEIEVIETVHIRKWWLPLLIIVRRTITRTILQRDLINHFCGDHFQRGVETFRQNFLSRCRYRLLQNGRPAIKAAADYLIGKIQSSVTAANIRRTTQSEFADAIQLIQSIVEKVRTRFSQEIATTVIDSADKLVTDTINGITRTIKGHLAGSFQSAGLEMGSEVFPADCRYCRVSGNTVGVVIEQSPQSRDIYLTRSLAMGHANGAELLHLAFPYLIFAMKFVSGTLSDIYLFYSNRPIQSLRDQLCLPNLPNTYSSGKICLKFPETTGSNSSMSELVTKVLDHWWRSRFNTDLIDQNYHPSTGLDPRISSLKRWQEASLKDPSFALTINWNRSEKTLSEIFGDWFSGQTAQALNPEDIEAKIKTALAEGRSKLQDQLAKVCGKAGDGVKVPKLLEEEINSRLKCLVDKITTSVAEQLNTAVERTEETTLRSVVDAALGAFDSTDENDSPRLILSDIVDRPIDVSQFQLRA